MNPLKTTNCPKCGQSINGSHIKPPLKTPAEFGLPNDFYGGKVKKLCNVTCGCGAKYVAFLMPIHNGHKIFDLADPEEKPQEKPEEKKGGRGNGKRKNKAEEATEENPGMATQGGEES